MGTVTKIEEKKVVGLKYDPTIWIAEGKNRFDLNWKNKEITWSRFLGRILYEATQTQETQDEYNKASKTMQDKIKDVGGYVGGTLKGGKRKSDTVNERYLLTFDLDTAPADFVESMQLDAPYAWAIYSTHKHTPEKPRYRFIVPLDRGVSPDEYEAITRKLAEEIGLQYFDKTTAQPSRLMYWPSYSRGAEYVCEYNDGKPLSADEILTRYPDWTDQSYWPVFPDEVVAHKEKDKKKEDPTKKKGLVGAFCKVYDVPAAIAAFIPDVYTQVDGKENRYTYAAGTTSGGLVIYDDGAHCYSNHGTDPASGLDLNAFDLVRIHLFGKEDENAKLETPVNRLPSYKKMTELVAEDKECRKIIAKERMAAAAADFEGINDEIPDDMDLDVSKKGDINPTIPNLLRIYRSDPGLKGVRYNELSHNIEVCSPLPWRKELYAWENDDDACLTVYLGVKYATFKKSDIIDALTTVARERRYHPVREYLKKLPEWDGVARAEDLFIKYLGADNTRYVKEVCRKWLLAGVCRAFIPGFKYDHVPVLSGPGGIGKSTLIAKLGGEWFSDNLNFDDMRDKAAAEKIQGTWINEISELKGMRKTEVESVKSFISRQEDIYRPAFGRKVEHRKRGCIFIGTSNASDYLKDITGNRRFLPVYCSGESEAKAWDLTADEVAQIWAEVMYDYDTLGDRAVVLSKEAQAAAEDLQVQSLEHDERMGLVELYLNRLLPEDWEDKDLSDRRFWLSENKEGTVKRESVCIMEIWAECFNQSPAAKKRADSDDITRILMQLGWKRDGSKRSELYGKQGAFRRK